MELSSGVFEMVQLGGVEYFIRLCCGIVGSLGLLVGMSMICRALYLWSEKILGFSQGEKAWFEEGELESEINLSEEMGRRNFMSGASSLPSPEEMERGVISVPVTEMMTKRKSNQVIRRRIEKFRRSHFKSDFQFKFEVVEMDKNVKDGQHILAFLNKKANDRKPIPVGISDGTCIDLLPISKMSGVWLDRRMMAINN